MASNGEAMRGPRLTLVAENSIGSALLSAESAIWPDEDSDNEEGEAIPQSAIYSIVTTPSKKQKDTSNLRVDTRNTNLEAGAGEDSLSPGGNSEKSASQLSLLYELTLALTLQNFTFTFHISYTLHVAYSIYSSYSIFHIHFLPADKMTPSTLYDFAAADTMSRSHRS